MIDKAPTEIVDVSHNEKNVAHASEPELAETGGRRKSVALNIVENPLKVSLATSGPFATSRSRVDR